MSDLNTSEITTLRRQARILILLTSAEKADITPMGIIPFHAFAFLSNVLAPVWDMRALEGKILKRKGGPFYPALQHDLDRMVGLGMVYISEVTHVRDAARKWRLEGRYSLNSQISSEAVEYLLNFPEEEKFASFAAELAYALSALGEPELERALVEDATYSDPSVSENNVLDFDQWTRRNPSANAAHYFNRFLPHGSKITPGEKLHLYVRHLHWRMYAR